jgi:undecaprenyl-diphosphatase
MGVASGADFKRRGISLVVFAAALWLATGLLFAVLASFAAIYDRFPSDERIAHAIQAIDVPGFGGFVAFVTQLGDAPVYVSVTLAVALAFALMREGSEAVLMLLTFAPRAVNSALKDLVERPRPSPDLVDITGEASGFAYPSGHTVGTAVLFGLLFFLLPALVVWRPLRWLLQAGCLLMVAAAGPARVYEGVHWPSDVLAGYLLALLFLVPAAGAYLALKAP